MPKVSIIIPVYGAAATIVRCLDSVLDQTLDDVECVLVDDHGTDESITLAKRHLAAYTGPKTFVFTATAVNGGPGAARNRGIELASGKYVCFLDADDTLQPNYCQVLVDAAQTVDADLACCDAIRHGDPDTQILTNPSFPAGLLSTPVRRKILRRVVTYLWTYLFRLDFLREKGIRFPDTHCAEDSCLVCCCWLSARSAIHVDKALYNYFVAKNSVSRKHDPQRWKQRLASFRELKEFARRQRLYCPPYRGVIRLMILKKGWILAAKDFVTNNL